MQTPGPAPPQRPAGPRPPGHPATPFPHGPSLLWRVVERVTWVAGLVLALSAFTDWYAGSSVEGPTIAVIAWHTGLPGKLVFFIGIAVLVLAGFRAVGIELPASVPESIVVIALGAIATTVVSMRVLQIPDEFAFARRGIGIWISLLAALALIVAGLVRANEEL
ncbi:MAG: hypothetical protein H0V84_03055 [Actinobacteria bacterium]|nr:hypothetical protein [Actinomycetota bacterium]